MGRGIKFQVHMRIQSLNAVPYQNAILYCKVRHKHGSVSTSRQPVKDNIVTWNETVEFPFKSRVKKDGAVDTRTIKISVRREAEGGRKLIKVGEVAVNLAEFAGRKGVERRYLLHSAQSSARQDNSVLKVNVSTDLLDGPPVFKAAAPDVGVLRSASFADMDVDRFESDSMSYDSSSTPRPLSEVRENPDEILGAMLAETEAVPSSSSSAPSQRETHSTSHPS